MSEAGRQKTPLTLELLNALVHYDPYTGHLYRKTKAKKNRGEIGDIMGGSPSQNGYWGVRVGGVRCRAHRIAWALAHQVWPFDHEIDHINGDPSDNRLCNLRAANRSNNASNMRRSKRNKSGYKGVSWHEGAGKWQAHIRANDKNIYLGCFDTPEEAHQAYCDKARETKGEFARFD